MTTEAASNRRQWQVLVVVVTGVFMASLDLFIVNIAFPQIHHEFPGTSLGSLSWILNAYAIVFAALLVPAGRWADAFGRKRAFLLGLGLFTAASAACAGAPSVGLLTIARGVQALGAALLMPTSLGLLLPEFPPQRRHVAIGVWAAVGGVAAAAGPPLGGLLVQASWRWVFVVNVPVGVIALAVAWRLLREIREPGATLPDVFGAGVLTAALGALVVAIVKGPDWGWLSPRTGGLFAVAAALIAVTAWRSAHHPAPVIEPAIMRVRAFSLATAGSVLFFMAFAAMLLGSVLYLTTIWREPILTAGLMLAPGPATAALLAIPGARLGKLAGPGVAGAIGALLYACGYVWWLTHVGADRHYALDWLPGMVVGGAGVGLVLPSLAAAAAATLSPARFATGIAVQTTGRQIGSALGIAILVALLGTGSSPADYRAAWWFMLAAALSAGATLAAIGRAPAPVAVAPEFAHVADVVEATA